MSSLAMNDVIDAAENGVLGGLGGRNFMSRLSEILNDDLNVGNAPHFSSMEELVTFTVKHTSNFRGLSHGYCTKGNGCKIRNAADPSHCINCSSYIATPKHLPHWIVIKQRSEKQLQAFDKLQGKIKKRFLSFRSALTNNINAANVIINQLTVNEEKAS